MSNQPIKPIERNIAIGAVIVGLASFPFILGQCKISDLSLGSKSAQLIEPQIVTPAVAGDSAEVLKLNNELEQAYGHLDVAQEEMTDARNAHYALQEEMKQLKVDHALQLAKTPKAIELPAELPVQKIIEAPAVETVEVVKVVKPSGPDPQLAILAAEIARLKSRPDQSKLKGKLKGVMDTNKAQELKIAELNKIISKDDAAVREQQINKTIATLREENTTLRRSETKLKADAISSEKRWTHKLSKSGDPYEAKIEELKGQLTLLRSHSVFATSVADLDETSGKLFIKLQSLENQNPTQLAASYKTIENELKSEDMTRVKFGTGSVSLDQRSQNQIDAVLKDIKPTDKFLIVGYASNQGDKKLNERLSSNRAKAVAERVLNEMGSENTAKAVYLGETTRFGDIRQNQCVELWKISK